MESPVGVIPIELMKPEKKAAVISWLQGSPLPGRLKVEYLLGWAIWVGVRVSGRDRRAVEATGLVE